MNPELKKQIAKRDAIAKQMADMTDKAKAEGDRVFSEDEQSAFDALAGQFELQSAKCRNIEKVLSVGDVCEPAMDIAKRLLDFGIHAPTTYFPMLVPECLLIEPTETESRETLDGFVEAMVAILAEARSDPARLKAAPYTMPVRRLDDVRAAKHLDLTWKPVQ